MDTNITADEKTLAQACDLAAVGMRTVTGRERTAEVVRKRAVVAWILTREHAWTQKRIAKALRRSTRQVKNLIRTMKK